MRTASAIFRMQHVKEVLKVKPKPRERRASYPMVTKEEGKEFEKTDYRRSRRYVHVHVQYMTLTS